MPEPDAALDAKAGDSAADGGEFYFRAPGVASVRWDEPESTVFVEWEGWADSAEFAALLDAEVRALADHNGSRLLADCRRQKVLRPADQEKADREWVPQALAAGLKQFAVVLPTSALAAMNLGARLGKVPDGAFTVRYFESVDAAKRWLAIAG